MVAPPRISASPLQLKTKVSVEKYSNELNQRIPNDVSLYNGVSDLVVLFFRFKFVRSLKILKSWDSCLFKSFRYEYKIYWAVKVFSKIPIFYCTPFKDDRWEQAAWDTLTASSVSHRQGSVWFLVSWQSRCLKWFPWMHLSNRPYKPHTLKFFSPCEINSFQTLNVFHCWHRTQKVLGLSRFLFLEQAQVSITKEVVKCNVPYIEKCIQLGPKYLPVILLSKFKEEHRWAICIVNGFSFAAIFQERYLGSEPVLISWHTCLPKSFLLNEEWNWREIIMGRKGWLAD